MNRVCEYEQKFNQERQALLQDIQKLRGELNKQMRDTNSNDPTLTNQLQQAPLQAMPHRSHQIFFEDAINAMELNVQAQTVKQQNNETNTSRGMEIKIAIQHKSETAKLLRLLKDKITSMLFQGDDEPNTHTEKSASSSDDSTTSESTPVHDNTTGSAY